MRTANLLDPLYLRARAGHGVLHRSIAHAQRIGGQFQIAKLGAIRAAHACTGVNFTHHVGVRHACIVKHQFGILIKTPILL